MILKYFLDTFLLNAVYTGYIKSDIFKAIIILGFCSAITGLNVKRLTPSLYERLIQL